MSREAAKRCLERDIAYAMEALREGPGKSVRADTARSALERAERHLRTIMRAPALSPSSPGETPR